MIPIAEERATSDSLDSGVDSGANSLGVAKGLYDTAQGIGTAAAEAGSAASASAAASGAGAGAATGTGAAAGTAAGGPAGTVMGAVAGLAVSVVAKPLIKAIIVIIAFGILVISSLPGALWEDANTYNEYREYIGASYLSELEAEKEQIAKDFESRKADGEFDDYDYVEYSYTFIPDESGFTAELLNSSTLIVSLFEQKEDWFKNTLEDFKKSADDAGDIISCVKENEESSVSYSSNSDGDDESTLSITMTYRLSDIGIAHFRSEFDIDDAGYARALEMSYNTMLILNEISELPMGGIGFGSGGTYPGGGTHNSIRAALAALEEQLDFFGGDAIIPLPDDSWKTTDEFGPRNFAPDPIHTGLDFAAAEATEICSAMDGIVLLRLTNMGTFGHHVVIYHGGDITTMYAHMSAFGDYEVGDKVKRGDVIGYVGQTGLSRGAHLHFEYQTNGAASNPRGVLPL